MYIYAILPFSSFAHINISTRIINILSYWCLGGEEGLGGSGSPSPPHSAPPPPTSTTADSPLSPSSSSTTPSAASSLSPTAASSLSPTASSTSSTASSVAAASASTAASSAAASRPPLKRSQSLGVTDSPQSSLHNRAHRFVFLTISQSVCLSSQLPVCRFSL